MYKRGFEEAEEPEIKLSSFIVQWRKQGSSRKTSTSVSLTTQKPLTVWIILWKILKELGTPDHLTCLLSNVYAGKKATVRVAHGTKDWFKIRTGIHQA